MSKRMKETEIREIIKLYENGISPKKIGEKFGILNNSVTRILKKFGVKKKSGHPEINKNTKAIFG